MDDDLFQIKIRWIVTCRRVEKMQFQQIRHGHVAVIREFVAEQIIDGKRMFSAAIWLQRLHFRCLIRFGLTFIYYFVHLNPISCKIVSISFRNHPIIRLSDGNRVNLIWKKTRCAVFVFAMKCVWPAVSNAQSSFAFLMKISISRCANWNRFFVRLFVKNRAEFFSNRAKG